MKEQFPSIKGIGPKYRKLLEEAGLDEMERLAAYADAPQDLLRCLEEMNAEKGLVRRMPGEGELRQWIAQATKKMLALPGKPGTPPPRDDWCQAEEDSAEETDFEELGSLPGKPGTVPPTA